MTFPARHSESSSGQDDPGLTNVTWSRFIEDVDQDRLFDIVQDIESYPLFVPGCVEARILSRKGAVWVVHNVFGFGPLLRSHFTTRAEVSAPHSIDIVSSDGPWRRLELAWRFQTVAGRCRIDCRVAFAFRSALMARLGTIGASQMERVMADAFERRARALRAARGGRKGTGAT